MMTDLPHSLSSHYHDTNRSTKSLFDLPQAVIRMIPLYLDGDSSIGFRIISCQKLRYSALDLAGCRTLSDVSNIASLSHLHELKLSGCDLLRDISPLTRLSRLQTLDLSGCDSLCDISALGSLRLLHRLDLSGCVLLHQMELVSSLTQLEVLNLEGCQILDISLLSRLSNLHTLILGRLDEPEAVVENIQFRLLVNLQNLDLCDCKKITHIDMLKGLSSLRCLYLSYCTSLENIEALKYTATLRTLVLKGCGELKDISPLSKLIDLQFLDLSWCKMKDISALSGLFNLQTLDLSYTYVTSGFGALESLVNVTSLNFTEFLPNVRTLNFYVVRWLRNLCNLEDLSLSLSYQPDMFAELSGLASLGTLRLRQWPTTSGLPPLHTFTNLRVLSFVECQDLEVLHDLSGLTNVLTLQIVNCPLVDVSSIINLISLQNLQIVRGQLSNLSALESLSNLRNLIFIGCVIIDLATISRLKSLRSLNIDSCPGLLESLPLGSWDSLQYLRISNLLTLQRVNLFADLSCLRHLSISCDLLMEDMRLFNRLTNLRVLRLKDFNNEAIVLSSRNMPYLHTLEIQSTSISDLQGLETLVNLHTLSIHDCQLVRNFSFLQNLPRLNTLKLNRSIRLEEPRLRSMSLRKLILENTPLRRLHTQEMPNLRSLVIRRCPDLILDDHTFSSVSVLRENACNEYDCDDEWLSQDEYFRDILFALDDEITKPFSLDLSRYNPSPTRLHFKNETRFKK